MLLLGKQKHLPKVFLGKNQKYFRQIYNPTNIQLKMLKQTRFPLNLLISIFVFWFFCLRVEFQVQMQLEFLVVGLVATLVATLIVTLVATLVLTLVLTLVVTLVVVLVEQEFEYLNLLIILLILVFEFLKQINSQNSLILEQMETEQNLLIFPEYLLSLIHI